MRERARQRIDCGPEPTGMHEYRVLITPNRSLSPQGMWLLFLAIAWVCLTVGVGFALVGAWLILPFAGLEVGVVAAALYVVARRAREFEQVVVTGGRLIVTRREGDVDHRFEFQAGWARVLMLEPGGPLQASRLVIRSHGRELEIARGLNREQKAALKEELGQAVGHAYT